MILTIARKELHGLFATPSTWLILAVLQFVFAWFFLVRLDAFLQVQAQLSQVANAPGATLAVIAPVYGTLAIIAMMLMPLFTMRLLAEEQRNQTLPLLLAAPVSAAEIVLGKFFGLLLMLLALVAAISAMVWLLALGTPLDHGLVLANALGLLLLCAAYSAAGLYLSSLTRHPVAAAGGGSAILFGLWLIDFAGSDGGHALRTLTPTAHFQMLNNGLIASTDLAYFVLFTAAFLLLTIRRLEQRS